MGAQTTDQRSQTVESVVQVFRSMRFNEEAHRKLYNVVSEVPIKKQCSNAAVKNAVEKLLQIHKQNWQVITDNGYEAVIRYILEGRPTQAQKPSIPKPDLPISDQSHESRANGSPALNECCIVVGGLPQGWTRQELHKFVGDVCCKFEVVPPAREIVTKIGKISEEMALLRFISGVMADLFFDVYCSEPLRISGAEVTLTRSYSAWDIPLLNVIKGHCNLRLVYINGVTKDWPERRLKQHFEEQVLLGNFIKSMYSIPGRSDLFMELASDVKTDLLFYRCGKNLSFLEAISKDLFICRSNFIPHYLRRPQKTQGGKAQEIREHEVPLQVDNSVGHHPKLREIRARECPLQKTQAENSAGHHLKIQEIEVPLQKTQADNSVGQHPKIRELEVPLQNRELDINAKDMPVAAYPVICDQRYAVTREVERRQMEPERSINRDNPSQCALFAVGVKTIIEGRIEEIFRQLKPGGLQRIQLISNQRARLEFETEAAADALMDEYIEKPHHFWFEDFNFQIFRDAGYVRPDGVNKRKGPVFDEQPAELLVMGLPIELHPQRYVLKAALCELLDRTFAANPEITEYGRNLLKNFYFDYRVVKISFYTWAATEAVLFPKKPLKLAGHTLKFVRTKDQRQAEPDRRRPPDWSDDDAHGRHRDYRERKRRYSYDRDDANRPMPLEEAYFSSASEEYVPRHRDGYYARSGHDGPPGFYPAY